jgi:hypothetical protein
MALLQLGGKNQKHQKRLGMSKQKKLHLVNIRWIDICGNHEWSDMNEIEDWAAKDTGYCDTVGWLLEKNRQYLLVASTKSDDENYNDINKIPIRNVLEINDLRFSISKEDKVETPSRTEGDSKGVQRRKEGNRYLCG